MKPTERGRSVLVVLLLAAAFTLQVTAGCTRSTSTTVSRGRSIGPFQVALKNRPARPSVGDNRLLVVVVDGSGRPVVGATVEMSVVMEAMGTMPRMQSRGAVTERSAGTYEIRYGLAMAGEWDVNLAIRAPEGAQAVGSWRLSTSTEDLVFVAGTPPAGAGAAPTEAAAPPGSAPPAASVNFSASGVSGFGRVVLDDTRRQSIGVRTQVAAARPIRATIRAAGKVAYDETRRSEVSLKFSGWVRRIHASYTGQTVRRGDPLIAVYSPELLAAQQEFLAAIRPLAPAEGSGMSGMGSGGPAAGGADPDLADAARQRLRLWDIAPTQIEAIARSGKPLEAVPILAPASGVVVEKNVIEGSSFTAGQPLYRIAPIDPVWVVASVYQYELPLVRTGMAATIASPSLAERTRVGRVSYVAPYLDPGTRTGEVRVTVPNARGDLKPGMFVDVTLERDLGTRLAIPQSAVLYEGDRSLVFVDQGPGGFVPREVSLGAKAGDWIEVRAGLAAGDVIVTSGNFLIAAESKLRAATP